MGEGAATLTMGRLFDRITAMSNLLEAAHRAGRGKHGRPNVAAFWLELEEELHHLREALVSCAYRPGAYRTFIVRDKKPRVISAAPFRDRLMKGAKVVGTTDTHSETPPHALAEKAYVEVVRLLLDKGASVSATDKDGKTPLDYAQGLTSIMQVLEKANAAQAQGGKTK